jgi:uncharacterized protein DUF4845
MQNLQRGVTLGGLVIGLFILIIVALVGFKVIPAYMEYGTAKNAIQAVARDRQGASVQEIRKAFDARAAIDDIKVVRAQDLEITKEGGDVVISFGYRKEVALFSNVGLYFDFAAKSK